MVARALALGAGALVLAGCGGRVYSDAAARRAAGGSSSGTDIAFATPSFATLAAVTDLELDPNPLFTLYEGRGLWVIRFATAHDAQAAVREGEVRNVDAQVVGATPEGVVIQHDNLVLVGSRRSVAAGLGRLP